MEIETGKYYKHKRFSDRVIWVIAQEKGYVFYYRFDDPSDQHCLFYKKMILDYEPYDASY